MTLRQFEIGGLIMTTPIIFFGHAATIASFIFLVVKIDAYKMPHAIVKVYRKTS
jgi:hypothetical protein